MSTPPRTPLRRATGVGAVLQDWLRQRGVADRLRAYRAWQLWNEVVGPQIAARAQPSGIRDGVLEIKVDQPVWMQQLQLMKPQILARLNQRLGGEVFRDIYLRRGSPAPVPKTPPPPKPLPPLTAAEEAQIDEVLKELADPELREGLRRVLQLQARLSTLRRSTDQTPSP